MKPTVRPQIVVAVTTDRNAIGRRGDLIARLGADMRHFRQLTTGGAVIMGRCTFESLPGRRPLPERLNIVVSRRPEAIGACDGLLAVGSLAEAYAAAAARGYDEPFVIGGGRIYEQAMADARRLHVTELDVATPADADTFFPAIDAARWRETSRTVPASDPKTGIGYSFVTYER